MAISLPDARQLSDEVLQALRLRALRGCELGSTEVEIADLLGVSRETVSRWWSAYATGGQDAIPHDWTGRPALSPSSAVNTATSPRWPKTVSDHGSRFTAKPNRSPTPETAPRPRPASTNSSSNSPSVRPRSKPSKID